jgi:hypothetical protein
METWKPVLGYEGIYEASDWGRIKSLKKIPHRILRPGPHTGGYQMVGLNNRIKTMRTVHRIVCAAFFGPIPEGMEINHKNGNKKDNRLSNLELVTPCENTLHSIRVLGNRPGNRSKGEAHHHAAFTEKEVLWIRGATDIHSYAAIARHFGVSRSAIAHIVKRRSWTHI